ncbi:tRNA pseudouridine(55) synthase TruB [Chitinilyticum piscinae]|uniref:tRNA pseudouridine synthase B n=1 Tax=Chitinilyticum piscinae TaxID=2866724 RepID=A0A8J7G003_9NEIS|nr:tRNA pseudouridine(55) synthase TruB [Chitinilyticum piscinae]MBE9608843.1 tRNA pseudouridine(55) synthase TruB [Chitinilyticum piscinae]
MAKRKIDGVLLLDKGHGWSSNQALQKARWLLQAEKGGHTGVLDPFATGLLPLCFGEATKFAQCMLDADKGYRATLCLGKESTTLDGEGEIRETGTAPADVSQIEAVLGQFVGPISQIPPMHSALKRDGKALYEYAREGVEIERAPRQVTIYGISLVSYAAPELVIDVDCSKGTYIRVLAQDIGRALGCGAYLTGLRRTRTAGFTLDGSISIESFEAMGMSEREALLRPADGLLAELPELVLDERQFALVSHGQRPRVPPGVLSQGEYRLYVAAEKPDNRRFIGLGEVVVTGNGCELRSKRLLADLHHPDA